MKIRVKRVAIAPDALIRFMNNGMSWKTIKGVPAGTRVRGFTIDPATQVLQLFIEHDSFEEISPYTLAPLLETEFSQI